MSDSVFVVVKSSAIGDFIYGGVFHTTHQEANEALNDVLAMYEHNGWTELNANISFTIQELKKAESP